MAGVNKVILVGNLGKDPEVRHLESGSVVANLTLATTEAYKDRNGNRVENTEWHDLELWDGQAKVAEQYLRKGSQIFVEGKIKTDTWQDEQGNNRKRTKIRVLSFTMLGSKGGAENNSNSSGSNTMSQPNTGQQQPASMPSGSNMEEEDDLPF
ncbi:single-stranded DNA-binding protein [Echinicola jeungdonensis]|uniref:Single-stranded DNA-binding protein n=1 Tax=Echinicola jeungdonensis TaxID=709343 RepID=A0ABV5J8I3_9BACT|nr:single-stranded DNA-binding protein [Echinicola jeungdonensis]MDN3669249.1 single-stranded DNA-binding protein [Echinicola jeungdonensis]